MKKLQDMELGRENNPWLNLNSKDLRHQFNVLLPQAIAILSDGTLKEDLQTLEKNRTIRKQAGYTMMPKIFLSMAYYTTKNIFAGMNEEAASKDGFCHSIGHVYDYMVKHREEMQAHAQQAKNTLELLSASQQPELQDLHELMQWNSHISEIVHELFISRQDKAGYEEFEYCFQMHDLETALEYAKQRAAEYNFDEVGSEEKRSAFKV